MTAPATRGRPREFDTAKALRGAMELFWKKGYDASTLPELLTAMGNISPPSFYAAFGSKEQAFAQAIELYQKEVGCHAADALINGATAREAFSGFIRATVDVVAPDKGHRGCLTALGAINSATPSASEMLRVMRARGQAMLKARVAQGIADGDVPKTADPDAVAAFYASVAAGLSHSAKDGATHATLRRIAETALEAWDIAVGGPPARARRKPRAARRK